MSDSVIHQRSADRVLLIEDERSIAEPFSHALEREGFQPTLAGSLAEARQAFADSEPDIVLLDLMLPDGDGRELARELRARSQVPIIMLTARGSEIDRVVGLELGADDYVVKPFAASEVIARIRAVLRRSRQQEPVRARISVGDVEVDVAARRAWLAGSELTLTRKEFDLLARLARSAGATSRRCAASASASPPHRRNSPSACASACCSRSPTCWCWRSSPWVSHSR